MEGELVGLLIVVTVIFMLTRRSSFNESEFNSYVINLNRRKDRLANFTDQWAKTDLARRANFKRVEANEGDSIDDVSFDKRLGIHFIEMTGVRPSLAFLTRSMIGCYKSHYKVFEEIAANDKPYGLIFEDDADISSDIYNRLSTVQFPAGWDIILLGHVESIDTVPGPPGLRKVKSFVGLQGYLASRQGAQKMLSFKNIQISMQIDHFMSKLIKEGVLEVFITDPILVNQGRFGSDLQMGIMG